MTRAAFALTIVLVLIAQIVAAPHPMKATRAQLYVIGPLALVIGAGAALILWKRTKR